MITIDCPFCADEATIDEALTAATCDGCGVSVDIAPETVVALDAAA